MIHILRFNIDLVSFFLGVVSTVLVGLLVWGLQRLGKSMRTSLKESRQALDAKRQKDIEDIYLQQVYKTVQRQHIAFELFALEEILIAPKVILPPAIVDPTNVEFPSNMLDELIPYTPGYADFASHYPISSHSLNDVVKIGGHFYLTGQAGAGKSTALASLVMNLSKANPGIDDEKRILPLFLDIRAIEPVKTGKIDPFDLVTDIVFSKFSRQVQKDLENLFFRGMAENRVCLLIDGVDELSPKELKEYEETIKGITAAFFNQTMIMTGYGASEKLLLQNQILPLILVMWNQKEIDSYAEKWSILKPSAPVESKEEQPPISPIEMNLASEWIKEDDRALTPLEITLRIWGTYAHDLNGLKLDSVFQAYLTRVCDKTAYENLPELVRESYQKCSAWIPVHTLRSTLSTESLAPLVNGGLLKIVSDDTAVFSNPAFASQLMKPEQTLSPGQIQPALDWEITTESLRQHTSEPFLQSLLTSFDLQKDQPLNANLLALNQFFVDPTVTGESKNTVLKYLFVGLQNEKYSLGLRVNLLSKLLAHPGTAKSVLLRELSKSKSHLLRQLSALGIGYIKDEKLVPILELLANDEMLNVRGAAFYALAQFVKATSLDQIVNSLMDGDEPTKQVAAGALSSTDQGHEILKKASKSKDILVRRAVVQAISTITADWVVPFLSQISVEDDQWLVRNAAVNSLEQKQSKEKSIAYVLPKPQNAGWLLKAASVKGLGITPGRPPIALLLEVLNSGSVEEQLAALDYLKLIPEKEVVQAIYQKFTTGENIIRDKAYYCMWWMQTSGEDIHSIAV